jgi:glycosyltransferase involved in cell wall biosynthesis
MAGAPPNVEIIEHMRFAALESVYAGATSFVSTSSFEGFPNTFLQAAKFAVPILSLDVDPDGFVTRHGCGIVAAGDLDRLAEAVQAVAKNPELRARYGDAGRRYVDEFHDVRKITEEFHDLIAGLLTPGTPRSSHH